MSAVYNIKQYPLKEDVLITVFITGEGASIGLSKDGTVTSEGKYVQTEFSNARMRFTDHRLLGNTGKSNFEKNLASFYKNIGIPVQDSATDMFLDYLKDQGYPVPDKASGKVVGLIVPTPVKGKPKEKSVTFKNLFNVTDEIFTGRTEVELDVHMSVITPTTKTVEFWMDIPTYIYTKCMEDPDVTNRPQNNYIRSESLNVLHSSLMDYSGRCEMLVQKEKDATISKKMLRISFGSGEKGMRDELNHAYLGQQVTVRFNWSVVYEYDRGGIFAQGKEYFSWKKMIFDKQHLYGDNKGLPTGVVDLEQKGQRSHFIKRPDGILVEWTQEREDFLVALENKFRQLSTDLNMFLKDLDDTKLDRLIADNSLKLLN